ncbi:DUF1566 domain-containing protein [Alginatibacterium sediminis]|uniref:DUF1566 domain-containing protein n=2 Tax=Alginatibacterium sediminis TaxID=2164068 RepID=A0A420E9F8_9ALTE|nr:DUF1566 domain-containing protein [Alginatibacterium sediminis]
MFNKDLLTTIGPLLPLGAVLLSFPNIAQSESYAIVDTNQTLCVGLSSTSKSCPNQSNQGLGQDAQYQGIQPSYTLVEQTMVLDNNTQLTWTQTTDINADGVIDSRDKLSYNEAMQYANNLRLGGHSDWRIPSIKELYSLILFDGQDPSGLNGAGSYSIMPFIDHRYFGFNSGDINAGERLIDSQYLSSTKYVSTTMNGEETIFGVNFIDGRIKGYGASKRGKDKTFYVLAVRGNNNYGINDFSDNKNGVISDLATGLQWQQSDSEQAMNWPQALGYCESLNLAGNKQWRLPNVKELQSIVDYSRSPDTSSSAALDPIFNSSSMLNEAGQTDYPNYWSSTTHLNLNSAKNAAYVAFGRSMGQMQGQWIDVHGAGSQRSDPKTGDASKYPNGHGPQGDAVRIDNYVRCVSGGGVEFEQQANEISRESKIYTLSADQLSMDQASNGKMGKNGDKDKNRQNGKPLKASNDIFSQMDRNKDGKLSKSEVKGPLAKDFDRIDRNSDGFISQDELPKRP